MGAERLSLSIPVGTGQERIVRVIDGRASRHGGSSGGEASLARRLLTAFAGTALVVGLPSAGYAVGLLGDGGALVTGARISGFTPASGDPRVARIVAERSGGAERFMRFTPAGSTDNAGRRVTVAVRIDQEVARSISVRSGADEGEQRIADNQGLRIAPTRYNLGLARGYQSFAKPAALSTPTPIAPTDMPDLRTFAAAPDAKDKPSRFAARVQLEEGNPAQAAPQLVRRSGQLTADQTLDVAGSYRLTRNLNVTAGLRYSQERDRLAALPDTQEQDSQAIYIGTQFRF